MPWYAMGLSIMATQASAITFISTTGQSYMDGMRFVQFYFGLPVAMVILSATAVPIFHRAKVYTAYEYLEQRFDAKTRALVTAVFLISRGLQCGLALSAPAIVLSVILGWPFRVTILIMGGLVVLYTTLGGIKAVTWADVQQMMVILVALVLALADRGVASCRSDVSFFDAVRIAGAAGKLNAVDLHFDWNDRYNLWSGLIGGMFLVLAYFGCDQSQVQRYLTGKSIGQSRLSLLFNAIGKDSGAVLHFVHRRDGVRVFHLRAAAAVVSSGGAEAGAGGARICGGPESIRPGVRGAASGGEADQGCLGRGRSHRGHYRFPRRGARHGCGANAGAKSGRRRHQLHFSFLRDALFAGGRGGAGHWRDFLPRRCRRFRARSIRSRR